MKRRLVLELSGYHHCLRVIEDVRDTNTLSCLLTFQEAAAGGAQLFIRVFQSFTGEWGPW
jgi:hypothetical protein